MSHLALKKIRNIQCVKMAVHLDFFQKFDYEKYHQFQVPEVQNNNFSDCKTNLSMAGLRIDERGGIYLNPLLDSNSAYFK